MMKSLEWPIFVFTLLLKALNGLLEIVGGILLLIIKPSLVNWLITLLTQQELSEDPKDLIATTLVKLAHIYSSQPINFAVFFLLSHGILKIFFVIYLLRKQLWAYPSFIIFLSIFVVYQIYRITFTRSIFLSLLTILDLFIIWLTFDEYRKLKRSEVLR